ncbi:unnamed protein product [Allacma fusca]|uniref:Uncharacterized protein n=1 Tax=Allacma fusca TaxID=39272 RepID=A0A8J2KFV0_9HEXA|nr:unnamed protein product [Allacma fusca]
MLDDEGLAIASQVVGELSALEKKGQKVAGMKDLYYDLLWKYRTALIPSTFLMSRYHKEVMELYLKFDVKEPERLVAMPLSSLLGPVVPSANYQREEVISDLESLRNHQPEGEWERLRALYRLFTLRQEENPANTETTTTEQGVAEANLQDVVKEEKSSSPKCVTFLCYGDVERRVYEDELTWWWSGQSPEEKKDLTVDLRLYDVGDVEPTIKMWKMGITPEELTPRVRQVWYLVECMVKAARGEKSEDHI